MTDERELPKYVSHKEVRALKIAKVEVFHTREGLITPVEDGYAPFTVSLDYMTRHRPRAGGYYVVYADGYASWSPGPAFEEGYTPCKP